MRRIRSPFVLFFICVVGAETLVPVEETVHHVVQPTLLPDFNTVSRKSEQFEYESSSARISCWGYEPKCGVEERYSRPVCDGDSMGWTHDEKEQIETFFHQGDFGYVAGKKKTLKMYCSPRSDTSSGKSTVWLQCSDHMHFCRGNNLRLDLKKVAERKENLLYKMDVLSRGDIGADCSLDTKRLVDNSDELSPLQSWGPEFRNFVELNHSLSEECDVSFEKMVYVMKLDAEVNMYHHFCDFLNLYASLHVNSDWKLGNAWTKDVQVILWQSVPYRSNFGLAWDAFTDNPLLTLSDLAGKRICFRGGVVFPLLPRMIFGLYYNTPLIPGCHASGLFRAFRNHVMKRIVANQDPIITDKPVRVTFMSRLTKHRRIINEGELIAALRSMGDVILWQSVPYRSNFGLAWDAFTDNPLLTLSDLAGKRICFRGGVVFPLLPRMIFGLYYNTPLIPGCHASGLFRAFRNHVMKRIVANQDPIITAEFTFRTPFRSQLEIIRNTDILIGIHGSGLTHCLFLPDWAAVFEIYNCGDSDCYYDLARLRGVKYRTWRSDGRGVRVHVLPGENEGHEKFTNYSFDVMEFEAVVGELVQAVVSDPRFPRVKKEEQKGRPENYLMRLRCKFGLRAVFLVLIVIIAALQVVHFALLSRLNCQLSGKSPCCSYGFGFIPSLPGFSEKRHDEWTVLDTSGEYSILRNVFVGSDISSELDARDLDVTLVSQCSLNHVRRARDLADSWKGPVSLALFLPNLSSLKFSLALVDVLRRCSPSVASNVTFHFVAPMLDELRPDQEPEQPCYSSCDLFDQKSDEVLPNYEQKGVEYPGNLLRNVALSGVTTEMFLVMDADMEISDDARESWIYFSRSSGVQKKKKTLYVLPAFESKGMPPKTKEDLLAAWALGEARPFYGEICSKCQSPTGYEEWMKSEDDEEVFPVHYKDPWEPFYIGHVDVVPRYDERFRQYGFNRISQVCEAFVAGMEFLVFKKAFVVHNGFKTAASFHSTKAEEQERNREKFRAFKKELVAKYPNSTRRC
ncbi:unnamed protein product [Notodromas monacha]|uniref:Beta-1,4-glucuronyltransferase 1 n=1 Tax=Notodromas monacha TaxID=399045 RepID=A0A7R9GAK1_9CRUS|nr:unnamed protein product [Notodromas monacha]CAG0913822.1 unnamed protein product [Notodromas monacha]